MVGGRGPSSPTVTTMTNAASEGGPSEATTTTGRRGIKIKFKRPLAPSSAAPSSSSQQQQDPQGSTQTTAEGLGAPAKVRYSTLLGH